MRARANPQGKVPGEALHSGGPEKPDRLRRWMHRQGRVQRRRAESWCRHWPRRDGRAECCCVARRGVVRLHFSAGRRPRGCETARRATALAMTAAKQAFFVLPSAAAAPSVNLDQCGGELAFPSHDVQQGAQADPDAAHSRRPAGVGRRRRGAPIRPTAEWMAGENWSPENGVSG